MEVEQKKINNKIYQLTEKFSSKFNYDFKETSIILAAGHGKRIKSQKSKMLHKIWNVPTVERVYNACVQGIEKINAILVVGIKAKDVIEVVGKKPNTLFAYQETQNGTGHAVQVGLSKIDEKLYDGIVYILPGDMGLIDVDSMKHFRKEFKNTKSDMMVLTGIYKGDPKDNSYGRILRVKTTDDQGKSSDKDFGKVIEIIEFKDILALPDNKLYTVKYNGRKYSFSQKDLINNNEFNSGVYAFNFKKLSELINSLSSDNVQNEIYITDLISLFNKSGYTVSAANPKNNNVVMGFNNKSVLKKMEAVARKQIYEKLKDIIDIEDPEDFFIDEKVVDQIIELDSKGVLLDIEVGKGVFIGRGVKLNHNIQFGKNVYVEGNVEFGKNISIAHNVHLSCFPNQTLKVGDGVEILWGDIIKGNIVIGENSRIESSVNMTGSDEFPLRIGKNVLIKGTSYLFGSIVENDVHIEHSVLIKKRVEHLVKRDGSIQPIRYYLPMPEGIDAVEDL
jgi:bifunctional UDP-N-acetylglucosamine pyrophosphorylase / glucosamine-1-phosphate N-acetyltransferase